MKEDTEIVSFKATKSFKTLIISNDKITNGEYSFIYKWQKYRNSYKWCYENGVYTKWNILTINNRTIFNVALKN